MSFRTPRARVQGLGSARSGTHHWWQIRVSSIALIPLTILFVFPFARALGLPYEEARAVYENPFNAVIAVLFIAVTFHHLMQGVQTVIEDYVHAHGVKTAMLLANTMICAFFGLTGVFAVLKIAFSG